MLTRIDVTPSNASFPKGTTQQFTATGVYSNGSTANLSATVNWSAADPTIVSFDADGLARGEKTGSSAVTASFGGLSGRAQATVSAAALTGLTLDPSSLELPKGLTRALTATAFYSDGSSRDVTAEASFLSNDDNIASVSNVAPQGVVTAQGVGETSIIASYSGRSAGSAITVTQAALAGLRIEPEPLAVVAGLTRPFQVVASFSDASQRDVTEQATVTVEHPAVAGLSASGQLQGVAAGSTLLSASYGDKSASAGVTVRPAVLTRLDVSPADASFPKGTRQQFTVRGTFSDQTTLDLTSTASWSAADPSVIELDAGGSARAAGVGQTRVNATVGDLTGSAQVQVTPAVVTHLALSPAELSLPKGLTQALTATATFSDGTSRDVTGDASFQSQSPEVASVSMGEPRGVVSALRVGQATLTADYLGQTASSTVTVSSAVLTGLKLQPGSASLIEGTSQSFTVTALFSDATETDVTSAATLSVEDPAVASVSLSPGVVEAEAPGSTSVVATFDTQTARAALTVRAARLTSLHIFPESLSLPAGLGAAMTASGTYDNGQTLDLTASVDWSAEDPSVAGIDASGALTALIQGRTEVIARLDGVEARRQVTVGPAVLRGLILTPESLSLPKGLNSTISVEGVYSDGSRSLLTEGLSWSIDDSTVASVDSVGQVTALGTGETVLRVVVGEVSGQARLTVTPALLRSLQLTPSDPQSLPKGAQLALRALGTFSDGSQVDVTEQARWSSSQPTVASVSLGLVQSTAEGTTEIICELDDQEAAVSLEVTPAVLASIEIDPASLTLPLGLTAQLQARGRYTDNTMIDLPEVEWSVSDCDIAFVSSLGKLSTTSSGQTTVSASYGGKVGSLALNVSSVRLEQLTFNKASLKVITGFSDSLQVSGRFSDGSVVDMTDQVAWSSLDASIASVSSGGVVTGRREGDIRIRARGANGVFREIWVEVEPAILRQYHLTVPAGPLPVGVRAPLTIHGTFSDGTTRKIEYGSSPSYSLATADTTLGNFAIVNGVAYVQTNAPGSMTIKVYNGYSDSRKVEAFATVEIVSLPMEQLLVTPGAVDIPTGERQQFAATAVFSDGKVYDVDHKVTWAYSGDTVSSIGTSGSNKGLFAAGNTVGTGTLTCTYPDGLVTTAPIGVVSGATVEGISIEPSSLVLANGITYQRILTATATYSTGFKTVIANGTWNSLPRELLTASSSGNFATLTARQIGTGRVEVIYKGVSTSIPVEVTDASLTSMTLSPSLLTYPVGLKAHLFCYGSFSDNSTREITDTVTWSSSDPRVAIVEGGGRLTTLEDGVVTITATDPGTGRQVAMNVTVLKKKLRSLAFDEGPSYLRVGTNRAFKVEGRYHDDTVYDLTDALEWSSSDPAVAAVANASWNRGRITSSSLGQATISVREPVSGQQAELAIELADSVKLHEVPFASVVQELQNSPDGDRLYVLTGYALEAYQASDMQLLDRVEVSGGVGMDVSADGGSVLIAHANQAVLTLVDTSSFTTTSIPLTAGWTSRDVAFGNNGYAYAIITDKRPVSIDLSSYAITPATNGTTLSYARYMSYDPTTSKLIFGDFGVSLSRVRRYGVNGAALTWEADETNGSNGKNLTLHPLGGSFVFCTATGNNSPGYLIYDILLKPILEMDKPIAAMRLNAYPLDSAFSPRGTVLYGINSSPYDAVVKLFAPESGRFLGHLIPESDIPYFDLDKVEVSRDGSRMYLYVNEDDQPDTGAGSIILHRLRP